MKWNRCTKLLRRAFKVTDTESSNFMLLLDCLPASEEAETYAEACGQAGNLVVGFGSHVVIDGRECGGCKSWSIGGPGTLKSAIAIRGLPA